MHRTPPAGGNGTVTGTAEAAGNSCVGDGDAGYGWVELGAPLPVAPGGTSADEVSWDRAITLDRFFRNTGDPAAVTPTQARIAWNAQGLHVRVRCTEPSPGHWTPPEPTRAEQVFESGDRVDVYVRPEWRREETVQVSVNPCGAAAGRRRPSGQENDLAPFSAYTAATRPSKEGWTAWVSLSWNDLGLSGAPTGAVGLQIARIRRQTGETLTPTGADLWSEWRADGFLYVILGGEPAAHRQPAGLSRLPDGSLRWLPSTVLKWPTAADHRALWDLQQRLANEPTTPASLVERVRLAQLWQDLLVLEGMSFHNQSGSWSPGPGEYLPREARSAVNRALLARDETSACAILDVLLRQYAAASAIWFADASVGNVRHEAWSIIDLVQSVVVEHDRVRLDVEASAGAGERAVTFWLSFPAAGGVRLRLNGGGRAWEGGDRPVTARRLAKGDIEFAPAGEGPGPRVILTSGDNWALSLRDAAGQEIWRVGAGDIRLRFDTAGRVVATDYRTELRTDEHALGLGERFDSLDQRGRILTLWSYDAWEGINLTCRTQMYKPIPLLHLGRGLALFCNTSYRFRADVGNTQANRLRLTAHGPVLDLYAWTGKPAEALACYTRLTGTPIAPPRWALEPWFHFGGNAWKERDDHAQHLIGVMQRFAELDLPHSAIYLEAQKIELNPALHAEGDRRGLRRLAWRNHGVFGGVAKVRELLGETSADADLPLMRRADGSVYLLPEGQLMTWLFPYIDFTHPRADELMRALWQEKLDLGIAGTMVDFADTVPEDAVFCDGRRGDEVHNAYAYDYHRGFRRLFEQRRGEDHILFARSAAPGSQRSVCLFAGDHPTNLVGLTTALRGLLNISLCGFSVWGCDIGGYWGRPDDETFCRFIQFGCFSPLMRYHGTETRAPWDYGPEAQRIYAFYNWLRMNLLDYLEASAAAATAGDRPMVRPMALAFPDDPSLARCDDQYLLGNDLLVAPVHEPAGRRRILLPEGRWTDLWSGQVIHGPATLDLEVPLDQIPVYLRAGAALGVHLKGNLVWGQSMTGDRVAARVVTPPPEAKGAFAVRLSSCRGERFLILYGAEVAGITCNGRVLSPVEAQRIAIRPVGWWQEGARVVVRLPDGADRTVEIQLANS